MAQEQHQLDDYLKGALAGKFIDNAGREVDCQDGFPGSDSDAVLQLDVPAKLPANSKLDLRVHIRNFLQRNTDGTLLLRGEESTRGATYEFEAPLRFDSAEACCCIAFNWRAPSYPTRIKWSASVQVDSQMGVSLPDCLAATLVTEAID